MWSALVAVLGVGLTGTFARRLSARAHGWPHQASWLLGLAAMVPPWLIEFVIVLGLGPETVPRLKTFVLAGIALGLLGVVVTDATVRRRAESGSPGSAMTAWALGVAALTPGWLILLLARRWLGP